MKRLGFLLAWLLVFSGCGGAAPEGQRAEEPEKVRLGPEDLEPMAKLVKAELATAVDEERMRPETPPSTEFEPTEPVIHLVGKIKNIPPAAAIVVRWSRDADPKPLFESEESASETFQFVASFRRTEKRFIPGPYHVRVYVNGREIGTVPFLVKGTEALAQGPKVSAVAVSEQITRTMKPKKPAKRFEEGVRRLLVSFDVADTTPESFVTVRWLRGQDEVLSQDIETPRDQRYSADFEVAAGIPIGTYTVKVEFQDEVRGSEQFTVGEVTEGPTIDTVSLGLVLVKDNMPDKAMSAFPRDTPVIQCGLRFLDLPPDSVVEVEWMRIEEDGDSLLYKNRSTVPSGGSGTMGAAYEPKHELEPGNYKAVILVNGEVMAESPFIVE